MSKYFAYCLLLILEKEEFLVEKLEVAQLRLDKKMSYLNNFFFEKEQKYMLKYLAESRKIQETHFRRQVV